MVRSDAQSRTGGRGRLQKLRNYVWPKMGWARYATFLRKRVLRMSASPHAIAAGVASGAAVSMLPLVGLHFILGFVLAFFMRGNLIAAAVGTAWGNPLTFPIFYAAAYGVGDFILDVLGISHGEGEGRAATGASLSVSVFEAGFDALWPVFKTMFIGALPLALAMYLIFYFGVRWLVLRFRAARRARIAERRRQRLAEGG